MNTTQQDALKQLSEIKTIMDRSSKFLSLSGLSGVFSGIFALLGAGVAYKILNWGNVRFVDYGSILYQPANNYIFWLLLVGASVLVLSILFAWYFTHKKATRLGLNMWDKSARKMFTSFIVPLVAGGLFCLILLLKYRLVGFIAPITLLFYGLALVNASKYTYNELKFLGYCEIALGLFSTFFIGFGLFFWAIGFGVLHIIYGAIMYKKHK